MGFLLQVIIEEGNLQENPLVELAAQQYLSVPGHENVLTLVRLYNCQVQLC